MFEIARGGEEDKSEGWVRYSLARAELFISPSSDRFVEQLLQVLSVISRVMGQ